jgi:hypothetical protein
MRGVSADSETTVQVFIAARMAGAVDVFRLFCLCHWIDGIEIWNFQTETRAFTQPALDIDMP